MPESLTERIDAKETWTFAQCLGLASEYNVKVRVVIATVFARGKQYEESESGLDQKR